MQPHHAKRPSLCAVTRLRRRAVPHPRKRPHLRLESAGHRHDVHQAAQHAVCEKAHQRDVQVRCVDVADGRLELHATGHLRTAHCQQTRKALHQGVKACLLERSVPVAAKRKRKEQDLQLVAHVARVHGEVVLQRGACGHGHVSREAPAAATRTRPCRVTRTGQVLGLKVVAGAQHALAVGTKADLPDLRGARSVRVVSNRRKRRGYESGACRTGSAPWPAPPRTACRPPCQTARLRRRQRTLATASPCHSAYAPPARGQPAGAPASHTGPAASRSTPAEGRSALRTALAKRAKPKARRAPARLGPAALVPSSAATPPAAPAVREALRAALRPAHAPGSAEAPSRWTALLVQVAFSAACALARVRASAQFHSRHA